jgi:putative ABC transport system ATP-binding protein
MPPERRSDTDGSALIELHDVSRTYQAGPKRVTVLQDISLRVRQGEFVSVVGPSGSGKSTLLNLITGIDRPTSGQVFVGGQPVHQMGENELAVWRGRNVGIIFQFFQLLPTLTVLENVVLPIDFARAHAAVPGPRKAKERAMDLLDVVGIADQAHKLPSALSGGQQQRAAIARALANDPPLVVGDEPTGNLDTATADGVFTLLQQLVDRGKTVVIVTHDRRLSARTERVLHLLDGRLHRDQDNGTATRTRSPESEPTSDPRSASRHLCLAPRALRFTPYVLRFTPYVSRFMPHVSRSTPDAPHPTPSTSALLIPTPQDGDS